MKRAVVIAIDLLTILHVFILVWYAVHSGGGDRREGGFSSLTPSL